jgi:heme-degrading monooxygenase HmoA
MKSPWKALGALEPDRDYVVLASSIPPRELSSTWRMFRGASLVRKQLSTAPGVVGYSMLARPLRKQYATLSVWVDEESLTGFARERPHSEVMTELSPQMLAPKFVRWRIKGRDGRPSWRDALRRLA